MRILVAWVFTLAAGFTLGRVTAANWHIVISDNHGRRFPAKDLGDFVVQFFESAPQDGVYHFAESQIQSITVHTRVGLPGKAGEDRNRIDVYTRPLSEACQMREGWGLR